MHLHDQGPTIFTGDNALSEGIAHAMQGREGVAVVHDLYCEADTDAKSLDRQLSTKEETSEIIRAEFDKIIEKSGAVINDPAKQAILDAHFNDFPIRLSTSDIGLMRVEPLMKTEGSMPHIDQQDHRHGHWLPPQLYTGASFSLPLLGSASWRTWQTSTYGLLDNMGTRDPLPIVRKAVSPDEKNTELITDESGIAFTQDVGQIVVVRQGDVIHRVRSINGSRLRAIGDITLMVEEVDLQESDIKQILEWAEEKRNGFLRQLVVKSAVRLEPAQ